MTEALKQSVLLAKKLADASGSIVSFDFGKVVGSKVLRAEAAVFPGKPIKSLLYNVAEMNLRTRAMMYSLQNRTDLITLQEWGDLRGS